MSWWEPLLVLLVLKDWLMLMLMRVAYKASLDLGCMPHTLGYAYEQYPEDTPACVPRAPPCYQQHNDAKKAWCRPILPTLRRTRKPVALKMMAVAP
jgi:hypothetical protein